METNQNNDFLTEPSRGLPGMLNGLTILTFIGCGLSYIGTIYGFFQSNNIEKRQAEMEEMQEKLGDGSFGAKMMEGSLEAMQKSYDYRYVLLITGLLFTTMCLIGAMQMRKLKKSGYTIYVIGELAPIVVSLALMGFSLMGGLTALLGGIFAIVFVILYTTQRKYLVN